MPEIIQCPRCQGERTVEFDGRSRFPCPRCQPNGKIHMRMMGLLYLGHTVELDPLDNA